MKARTRRRVDPYGKTLEPLSVGDVITLTNSKKIHMITEIAHPYAYVIRVKTMGDKKTYYKRISRWDLKSVDVFLTAVYKANKESESRRES